MKNDLINDYERLDDLNIGGLRIIQNPSQFCFGVDAVLLADFASYGIKKQNKVIDLCSGNGIIPILLTHKTAETDIVGLEIQEDIAEMAMRSVKFNDIGDRVDVICGDLKNANQEFGKSSFNNVTCNPPYKEYGGGLINKHSASAIARHEIMCNLEDIIKVSAELLIPQGKLAMIHRPERLIDIVTLMRKYKIEPKRLRFIHPSANKTATMILVEGAYCGKPKLFLEPPLYIYEGTGTNYTSEINSIYERM